MKIVSANINGTDIHDSLYIYYCKYINSRILMSIAVSGPRPYLTKLPE